MHARVMGLGNVGCARKRLAEECIKQGGFAYTGVAAQQRCLADKLRLNGADVIVQRRERHRVIAE